MKLEILEPGEWSQYPVLVLDLDGDGSIAGFDERADAELFIKAKTADSAGEPTDGN